MSSSIAFLSLLFSRWLRCRHLPPRRLASARPASRPTTCSWRARSRFSSDFEELGAGFTSGSNSYFGGLGISSYAFDGSDANVRLGGRLGSQVPVSASGRVQACPLLSASYGLTTKDYNGTGGDLHTQSYGLGLAIGGELMRSNRVALVPSVSATVLRDVFRVTGGLAPTDDQDTYILAGAAVGIVLSDALAIRPAVAFPINAAFDEPVFSIGLVLNYGGRR